MRSLQLLTSVYAEHLGGRYGFPDSHTVRNITGVALPSAWGEIVLFASAQTGHRRGLAAYEKERSVGFGMRAVWGRP